MSLSSTRVVSPLLIAWLAIAAMPSFARAQSSPPNVAKMSLEELMGIEVTAVSRREQRAADVAAAVYVITQEDIRRSGLTTIPDLLRLAPGVDVAQVNGSQWAVTVRGFNDVSANKLLVLVDGRSVYERVSSGVIWSSQDLMIDDIDRIEVIRGPAAAMWGANAVNGVINIVSKTPAETQGGLVRVEGGGFGTQTAARYGGTMGTATYRAYAQWTRRVESVIVPDFGAGDASHSITTGLRTDWTTGPSALSLEGAYTAGRTRPLWPNLDAATAAREPVVRDPSDARSAYVLGGWTRTAPGGASLKVQSFVDIMTRHEPIADYRRQTFDVDSQYQTAIGTRHDLVAGVGYRYGWDKYLSGVGFSMNPVRSHTSLVTGFVQDEIGLLDKRVALTLGSQLQYDSDAGAGMQPSARLMWKLRPRQRIWLATSRALRTPSRYERGVAAELPPMPSEGGLPIVVISRGNRNLATEGFVDAEAGYRLEIGAVATLDVTGFAGRYNHLRSNETADPVVEFVPFPRVLVTSQFENRLNATTRGVEVAGQWAPAPMWRVNGSYSAFHLTPSADAGSRDIDAAGEDGTAPRSQWQVGSTLAPGARQTLAMQVFHVGSLKQIGVAAYTRVDVNAEWRLTRNLTAVVSGQNVFDRAHVEFGGPDAFVLVTQIPRSVSLRLRWTVK